MRLPEDNPHQKVASMQATWTRNRLKQLRYLAGMSLADVGERLGCDPKTVAAVERGRYSTAQTTVAALISAYEVTMSDFFATCPQPDSKLPESRKSLRDWVNSIPESKGGRRSVLRKIVVHELDFIETQHCMAFSKFMCERYSHLNDAEMVRLLEVLMHAKEKEG